MRFQERPLRAYLLFAFTFVAWSHTGAAAGSKGLVKRDANLGATHTATSLGAATLAASLDKPETPVKDAPIDGKDGRPHEGPFVETAAERDRKKAKVSGDDVALAGKKPGPKGTSTDLPESNEGVMDDRGKFSPKEGQRGTEGGISEKSKGKLKQDALGGKRPENKPEEPKEAPPLPDSEEKKIQASTDKSTEKDEKKGKAEAGELKDGKTTPKDGDGKIISGETDLGGLSKPADLPGKPHDIPLPIPAGSEKSDPLAITKPSISTGTTPSTSDPEGLIQPLHSLLLSYTMIIVSEIGDKTFLVAALMAMKHPPLFVFSAAFPALVVMTVGSAVMGHAAPMLLPPRLTNFAAALLFLVFGAKMLNEGRAMSPDEGVGEEMREVESELEEKEAEAARFNRRRSSNLSPYVLEGGRKSARSNSSRLPAPPDSPPSSPDEIRALSPARKGESGGTLASIATGAQNLFSLLLSPAWVQTFMMTFLGEWGDRSQIATIAMAAGQNYWWVTFGAVLGHMCCTGVAVIGGRAIAGRVSMRTVTLGGAVAFLVFGFVYLAEAFYYK